MALYFIHTLQLLRPARPQRLRRVLEGRRCQRRMERPDQGQSPEHPPCPRPPSWHPSRLPIPPSPLAGARVLRVGLTGGFILPVIIGRYFGDLLLFYGVTRRCAEIMLPGDSPEWHMRNEPRKDGRDCSVGPAISQRRSCLC